jgi:hypothetical protein
MLALSWKRRICGNVTESTASFFYITFLLDDKRANDWNPRPSRRGTLPWPLVILAVQASGWAASPQLLRALKSLTTGHE